MFQHSVATLRESFQFFRENPRGVLTINHPRGGFAESHNRESFLAWFRKSLDRKINAAGRIDDAPESIELERFHRTYTGTRNRLRSHELRRVSRELSKSNRSRFLAAFANRVSDDD